MLSIGVWLKTERHWSDRCGAHDCASFGHRLGLFLQGAPITTNGCAHHSDVGPEEGSTGFRQVFLHELNIGPGVEDATRTYKIGQAELAAGEAVE